MQTNGNMQMSYQVLARKYRPQTFDEVIAQEHVTRTLKNALLSGRIGSGYLFCGPRGTGKTSVARILAKSINCDKGPTPEPCGECDSCKTIGGEGALDVREIDAASNTGVDDVRVLRENIRYGPSAKNRKRIYIIDEVHRLSGPAFDALLKTLEEPPPHAMFIFATTDPQKVPDTIHSRTQRFDFRRVSVAELAIALGVIAKKEGVTIDENALRLIARRGEGSVRDSVSLLDQIISFSSNDITAEQVSEALGLVDQEFLFNFVEALARGDSGSALTQIAELADSGADIREFIRELAHHFRSLTILRAAGVGAAGKVLNLLDSELERLQTQLDFYSVGDLVRLSEILTAATRQLKDVEPRWALEMATVKMAYMESTVTIEEALAQLQAGAPLVTPSGSSAPQASQAGRGADLFNSARTQANAPASQSVKRSNSPGAGKPAATAPTQAPDITRINTPTVRQHWSTFLGTLKGPNRMLASQLAMASVAEAHESQITVLFPGSAETNKKLVEKAAYRVQIEQALKEFFGAPLHINYDIETGTAASAAGPADSAGKATGFVDETGESERLLAKDDKFKSIVEQVDGEVVRVRGIKNKS